MVLYARTRSAGHRAVHTPTTLAQMLGDSILRGTRPVDFLALVIYSIIGILIGLVLVVIAYITAQYTNVEFPTGNDGQYGFLMKSVQPRVPLASVGGGTVSAPSYNSEYNVLGATGSPIDPTMFYNESKPFSTCAWWSRLVCQKAPTDYTPSQPYIYCGTFNLYRSKTVPSFAITIARPYALGAVSIVATKVCGQEHPSTLHSRSMNISDAVPTCFTAPLLWNVGASRPYLIGTEVTYFAREFGNMTSELTYNAPVSGDSLRVALSEITPYVIYTISPGTTMTLNQFYRDSPFNNYQVIKLENVMAMSPPPITVPNATHMKFQTVMTGLQNPHRPELGLSQTSIVVFEITFDPPATVTQLADYTVLVTADGSPTLPCRMVLQPSRYYIGSPVTLLNPVDWVKLDSLVVSTILASTKPQSLRAFVSNTSSGGNATLTYASDAGQPIFFVPSLSMTTVGKISGAEPIPLPPGISNYWLSPQGPTQVYVAQSGRFDVSYPLITPPRLGIFDIYPSFDGSSLKRLTTIFNRDLEALYSIDIQNDSFYDSVRKIFTFAQYTYAVFNYPSSTLTNVLLPPLRTRLAEVFDALIQTDITDIRLGFNPNLFTVAAGSQEYGVSQNQSFGDNHVGQYGMMLFTYYILVSIQFDNTARRSMRDRYQSVMVDLMRDFAQPYVTDQYIPSMRHFDYGVGLSWQTSSIIEASSVQVAETINGYYAAWLVSQLFSDNKLRDFYRAILSIELATHQEYRLSPLAPQGESSLAPIYQMIVASNSLFNNMHNKEVGIEPPLTYSQYGTVVYLLQGAEIVMHGVRNNHPDYRYLLDFVNPNTVADFSAATFYRPMTPLTIGVVPLTLGINLQSFQTTVFTATAGFIGSGMTVDHETHNLHIVSYDKATGIPTTLLTLQENPASFMTVEAAYSLSNYAQNYVVNYTWAGANLPEGTCAIIPATDLPSYLSPVMQYNRLGIMDSNTVLWIQYVILARGPRNS